MPPTIHHALILTALFLLSATTAHADDPPLDRGLGQPIAPFTLPDTRADQPFPWAPKPGQRATVVVFMGIDCPLGNLYLPRLAQLHQTYASQGVLFLGINSNASESTDQIAAHARQFQVPFPVLRDPGNAVADKLQAVRTCEALVIDQSGTLRYRGCIDDQFRLRGRKPSPTRDSLREALDELLGGRPITTPATPVEGCPIERAL